VRAGRALAIEAAQTTSRGKPGRPPPNLRLDHHAADRVHHDDRRVGDLQRGARLAQEAADPGVNQVDLRLFHSA
jgi:hypothetical protein